MKTTKRISRKQLQKHIDGLIALAKTVTPDVTSEILIPGYDGQHAWLSLYVPDEFDDQIDELVSERVYDIFVNSDYDIGALVYDKSQLRNTVISTND